MTRKRTGDPWMPSTQYGRALTGLTVNLLVREVAASLPFFTEVLGLKVVYSDPDFAALEFGSSVRMMLHADHAYDRFEPEVVRLAKQTSAAQGLRSESWASTRTRPKPGRASVGSPSTFRPKTSSMVGASAGSRIQTATCLLSES